MTSLANISQYETIKGIIDFIWTGNCGLLMDVFYESLFKLPIRQIRQITDKDWFLPPEALWADGKTDFDSEMARNFGLNIHSVFILYHANRTKYSINNFLSNFTILYLRNSF